MAANLNQYCDLWHKLIPKWRKVAVHRRKMAPTWWNLDSNGGIMAQTGAPFWSKACRCYFAHAVRHPVYSTWRCTCRANKNSAPQRAISDHFSCLICVLHSLINDLILQLIINRLPLLYKIRYHAGYVLSVNVWCMLTHSSISICACSSVTSCHVPCLTSVWGKRDKRILHSFSQWGMNGWVTLFCTLHMNNNIRGGISF